jgi:hypothetical protein
MSADASHASISSTLPTPSPTGHFTSLILGNKTTIRFSESETPDPPAVSFAHDIPRLNAMWDDTTPHWNGSSVLVIQGHPIAITYWRDVYAYAKSKQNQWKGTKAKWFEWKVRSAVWHGPPCACSPPWQVVVERWRQGTPSEFWAEFSTEDGKHLTFTAIINRLRLSRKTEDERICEIAKAEYGVSFAENFSYRKGGVKKVMTDPTIIAKHYRQLQDS